MLGSFVFKVIKIRQQTLLRCFCKIPIKIEILPEDLSWKYIRGSGKGGQKVNTTSNCVQLTHIPTSIQVKCHKSRDLETNRHYAIKSLKEKLDFHLNGELSKKEIERNKIRKQNANRRRKSLKKHSKDKIETATDYPSA